MIGTKFSASVRAAAILLAVAAGAPAVTGQDNALRAELERVYFDWRGAIINRDTRAWQRSTSRYRQVHTHNMIVSQNMPYPEAVFQVPLSPPDISRLRLLEVEASAETAHLVYFGRIDLGLEAEEIPDNILVLRFIRDPEGWRFDTSRMVNLQGVPDVRASLKQGNRPDFLDEPEFTPPAKAPPVPKVCKKPEHMAAFQVESIGYETVIRINGFDYPPVRDVAVNQLVIGGLDRGENIMELSYRPVEAPPGEERSLEINVMVVKGESGAPPIPVHRYRAAEPAGPVTKKVSVWVDNSVLKR
jgi:hypothetical protein